MSARTKSARTKSTSKKNAVPIKVDLSVDLYDNLIATHPEIGRRQSI